MNLSYFFCTLICCVIISIEKNVYGARILGIFPLNVPSRFVMFREILKALTERGHRVDVVSHFPLKRPFDNYTNIINLALIDNNNNLTLESPNSIKNKQTEYFPVNYGNKICHLLAATEFQTLIKNPPNDPPYDLVITELFFAHCYLAFGKHLNVPVVGVTSEVTPNFINEAIGNPLNTAFVPEYNDGSIFGMNFIERFKNTIFTSWYNYRIKKITETQTNVVKKYFGPEMSDVNDLTKNLSLLLVNSHYTINGIRPFTPAVVEVGGLHIRHDKTEPIPQALQEWMNNSPNGFIYISFGSFLGIELFPKEILAELYDAFDKLSPIRILIKSMKPKDLPSNIPQNVLGIKWFHQMAILKHKNIRGFVTHGGTMAIQEAVAFKVPFVGIPIFSDQPRNVKNCVEQGVAVSLKWEELTSEKFVDAVKTIVNDPKYKNNMNALSKKFMDRPKSPRDIATFWIEYILKYGGDSLRSPAVQLASRQLALLEIYAAITIAILALIFLFKLIISYLVRRLMQSKTLLPTSKKIV